MADPNALTVPLTDDDHYAALVFICVTVTLCALTLATLVARISMKFHHGLRLGWDDYLLVVGCVRYRQLHCTDHHLTATRRSRQPIGQHS
jgi:hypothetical protein